MFKKYDIRNCNTGNHHDFNICVDNDGDLAILIMVQCPDLPLQACKVKIKDLHPDYYVSEKFLEICLSAAGRESVPDLLRMPYDNACAKLAGEENITDDKENSNRRF